MKYTPCRWPRIIATHKRTHALTIQNFSRSFDKIVITVDIYKNTMSFYFNLAITNKKKPNIRIYTHTQEGSTSLDPYAINFVGRPLSLYLHLPHSLSNLFIVAFFFFLKNIPMTLSTTTKILDKLLLRTSKPIKATTTTEKRIWLFSFVFSSR